MSAYDAKDVYNDLLSLSTYFHVLAASLYDLQGDPDLNKIVVPASQSFESAQYKFPLNRTFKPYDESSHTQIFSGAVGHCDFESFKGFLSQNGIETVSEFSSGTSANVWLGKKSSGDLAVIRIPQKNAGGDQLSRLDTPIVEQPFARMGMDGVRTGAGDIEILAYRPVLPDRGIIVIDHSVPGHNLSMHEEFAIMSADGSRHEMPMTNYESALVTFAAVLKMVGYEIQAARDIAVSPQGAPVFVDPGTIRQGKRSLERSYRDLKGYMENSHLFTWEKPPKFLQLSDYDDDLREEPEPRKPDNSWRYERDVP
ncbi:MAG: hypothetical protein IT559_01705 [Alphaproteobacteria bacterium]|nr:hypothetical protein [Alphaproteobacteria bacterium]